MLNNGDEVLESEFGKISLCSRRKYEYPEELVEMQKLIDEKKQEAVQRGHAPYTESHYIRYDG